jgi:hypothetical protein
MGVGQHEYAALGNMSYLAKSPYSCGGMGELVRSA